MKQIEDNKTIDMIDVYDQEEAHYVHTINAFVELIVLYGWDTVVGDLRKAMGDKEW